ncbi:hypothetical protein MKEN_01167300 [Mycena kentingensis (nom. inval.)]|nr:hypothetical protein MKEN_01167300 [Mycena kentingensis (nom. inval.)]
MAADIEVSRDSAPSLMASRSHTPNGAPFRSAVGLSNSSIAQGRRAMLDLINRLQKTGVQLDIDLPRIAVIGNQSAGKSSLIESISGVTLPRASGTCTRCPTECRLSHSDAPWKCIVELRFITDKDGSPLGQAKTEPFGDAVSEKEEVENRIRRAQRAILNPSKAVKTFLEEEIDDDARNELSFSTNYISLSISGPGLADLSFVDLPGLIASVSSRGGDDRDIKMVEALVASYICKPSCVILLTVACETDFENQGAHNLVKKYDPKGMRTVGVLTKPDRIPAGEEENWIPLIRNEQETLKNNWFCVRQPGTADLKHGMSWAEARERENDFFSLTAPWSKLDAVYQKYLRTPNLVDRLSTILSELISKRLPEIHVELDRSIQQTYQSLQNLPRPPSSDPVAEVAAMLSGFVQDLKAMVEGIPVADGLIQNIRPAQERFRRAIQMTAPNFSPLERSRIGKRAGGPGSEPEGESYYPRHEETYDFEFKQHTSVICVDDAAKRANDARARELPGHHPFAVQVSLINEFTVKWGAPAHGLCDSVGRTVSTHMQTLVSTHFAAFGQGGLEQRIFILMQQHLKKRTEAAHELVGRLIALETPGPMTLNEHYLSDYKQKYLGHYRTERAKSRNSGYLTKLMDHHAVLTTNGGKLPAFTSTSTTTINTILGELASLGLTGLKSEDLMKLLPDDKMTPALNIMADVRAYFQVAYKRVADNIPLAIDYELTRGVARNVLPLLYTNLGVGGAEGARVCRELAQESPGVATKREELTKKLERLQIANAELVGIQM